MADTELRPAGRKHRRIAYRVRMARPFRHSEDNDIIDGVYSDPDGGSIGLLIPVEDGDRAPQEFLVVPNEQIPLVHVEAALENDHRVSGYEQVFGLIYDEGETPAVGVAATGDRWDAGDIVVYTFESDEEALAAQESPAGV
jgi:hypothetical protein